MIITPTTKKLSKKLQYAATDMNQVPYKPLFDDEVFYQVNGTPFLFASQYGRLIRTYKSTTPRLLNPYYDPQSGYTTIVITTPKRKNGKESKRTSEGLHELIAKVWCDYPTFLNSESTIPADDKVIQIHHLIKVKKNLTTQSIDVNFANNLFPVYKRYHSTIEDIRNIKFLFNGKWYRCDIREFDYIADKWDIPLKDLYELILGQPESVEDGVEIYKLSDEKVIKVRKYKSIKGAKKKSKNKNKK